MTPPRINEDTIEQMTLTALQDLGWHYTHGGTVLAGKDNPWRERTADVILRVHLEQAVRRLNPQLPEQAVQDVVGVVCKADITELAERNSRAYDYLKQGVPVRYQKDGREFSDYARLIDFQNVSNNRFDVINQFTIKGKRREHRPDVMCFVNGLPVVMIELKNPADDSADISKAYQQLQTYKENISEAFIYNQLLVISDGVMARLGSLTADFERFTPWRVVDERRHEQVPFDYELDGLLQGVLSPASLLDYIQNFVIFERGDKGQLIKKIGAYHQYYGVNQAVECTLQANAGDGKIGVVWHTQGSGKSLSMLFYAGKVLAQSELANPTLVIVTDRNDLDGQLFATFSAGEKLIRQTPIQADGREELRAELACRETGGVIFTTIQKFGLGDDEEMHPVLNVRKNIIVITDEAHRSQYGFGKKLRDGKYSTGYAKHLRDALPNASFIGFTGTPISMDDKDTQAVFGRYVSIYDIHDAVADGATVPIIYEARQIRVGESDDFDALMAQANALAEEDTDGAMRLREQVMGADARLDKLACDLVAHYEKRITLADGKAMIVAMSRKICVNLYNKIIALRPNWHSDDVAKGAIKIVMTGSASDEEALQKHLYSAQDKKLLEKRFKDPDDELRLVIVRDMWLTGFDAPCCHTMYIDKPMQGHNLMQAIARVNRVFKNKSRDNGGLIVDYVGLSEALKEATRAYTKDNGKGAVKQDIEQVYAQMLSHIDVVRGQFASTARGKCFDLQGALRLNNASELVRAVLTGANHIIALDNEHQAQQNRLANSGSNAKDKTLAPTSRKKAFMQAVSLAKKGYSLCASLPAVKAYEQELAFFDAVRATIVKNDSQGASGVSSAERQIRLMGLVNQALVADEAIDLFALQAKDHPNISILSDEFLRLAKDSPYQDLWVLASEKYLRQAINDKASTNLGVKKDFQTKLSEVMNQYHNQQTSVLAVLEELLSLSKAFGERMARGENLGLSPAELAFYDALAQNDSAAVLLGDEILSAIAKEITDTLRKSVTVDWQYKDAVQAKMRQMVRRALQRYKYPPDAQPEAVEFVLAQAEALASEWAA